MKTVMFHMNMPKVEHYSLTQHKQLTMNIL